MSMSRWRFQQWGYDEGPINSHRPRYLYPAYAARRNRICCGLTACQPRRLQWVMLMNPSFSNAPISNLLEATRSTELRLARNHAVLSFCVGAPPMASLNTLSVMRHRHLCPCLSTMPKAIPSNSISNPIIQARQRHQLLLWQCCHYSRVVAIMACAATCFCGSCLIKVRMFDPRTQRRGRRSCEARTTSLAS